MVKKPGPPPTGKGTIIGVRMQPELLAGVDAFIAQELDQPGRPEAVRRIVKDWLKGREFLPRGQGGD